MFSLTIHAKGDTLMMRTPVSSYLMLRSGHCFGFVNFESAAHGVNDGALAHRAA